MEFPHYMREIGIKKINDDCKLEERFQKNSQFSVTNTRNIMKTTYNEGHLYLTSVSWAWAMKIWQIDSMYQLPR